MAKKLYAKNGEWHTIKVLAVKASGTWRYAKAAYVKDNGSWKLFYGGNSGTETFNVGSTTWTVPDGVYSITITGCGGAGPGGSGDGGANYNGPGGGGGGANLITSTYSVIPGTVLAVTCGAAGTPPTYESQTGSDGIPTTVSGTGVSFATGSGKAGRGYYSGAAGGAGADGANSGGVPTAGTSTNGGANGGSGGGYYQAGSPGENGKLSITY